MLGSSTCEQIFGPMRVIPNGEGSELMFTLFRLPRMSDAEFVRDASLVERDLLTLKDRDLMAIAIVSAVEQ